MSAGALSLALTLKGALAVGTVRPLPRRPWTRGAPMLTHEQRMNRPCADCKKPIGRSHLKAKLCYACRDVREKEAQRVSRGVRPRPEEPAMLVATRERIRAIVDVLVPDAERREGLVAALEAGAPLRLFVCACRALYLGANRNRCVHCVAADVAGDRGGEA